MINIKRLLSPVVCAAVLAACGSAPQAPTSKPATMDAAMLDADAALKAGNNDKAFSVLRGAAKDFPADKTPWLRMAQLRFDNKNYGEAIVNGLEALERDGDDVVAYSLVAVSGLRVTSKALADLTQKNNLSGSVRSEAQDLAKLLRSSLNEETLVPTRVAAPRIRPVVRPPVATPAKPVTAASDPFGGLK